MMLSIWCIAFDAWFMLCVLVCMLCGVRVAIQKLFSVWCHQNSKKGNVLPLLLAMAIKNVCQSYYHMIIGIN